MRKVGLFLLDLLKTQCLYTVIVFGGTAILMVISAFIGYVPFSDRPGPGWYGWRFAISLYEVNLFGFWALMGGILGAIFTVPAFGLARLMAHFRSPRWLIAVIFAPVLALLSFWMALGVGWYIAIDAWPVLVAGALGGLFGAWLVPRKPRSTPHPQEILPSTSPAG